MTRLRVAQALVFVAALTLQVRVHAAEPDASLILTLPKDTALTEVPENCLSSANHCAIKTSARGKFDLPVGRSEVVLSSNTSLVKSTSGGVTFMTGAIWVQTPEVFTVETEFGEIHTAGSEASEFWVIRRDGKVWAQAIENTLYLRPRGGQTDIQLEAGEELWLGGVQENGIAASGFSQPIFFPDFAHQWALVYPGDRKDFKDALEDVEVQIKEAAARVAAHRENLVQRQIASQKEAVVNKRKAKGAVSAHDQKFRDLFRAKVLGD